MSLLSFDLCPSTLEAFPRHRIDSLTPRIEHLRSELTRLANPIEDPSAPLIRDDRCFFRLPEFQYADYLTRREDSDLGRIFRIANGLHDDIDAVVVLGETSVTSGPRCLMNACCDPYHNEMTRATRGSKPRLYFGPNPHDNDAVASLLSRLRRPDAESPCEKRWALVSLGCEEATRAAASALRILENELRGSLGEHDRPERFIISMDSGAESECFDGFRIPQGIAGARTVLSPVGMLPAAMLGLDCMKLLEGAVAVNDHFRDAPAEENIVIQLAALHHLATRQGRRRRSFSMWSAALVTLGRWYEELIRPESIARIDVDTAINPRDWRRWSSTCRHDADDLLVHHLVVGTSRCDAIRDHSFRSMDEEMADAYNRAVSESVVPSTLFSLSQIDTSALGRFFQLAMIATWIECRLDVD